MAVTMHLVACTLTYTGVESITGLQKFDVQWAFILEQNRRSSEVYVREVTVYVSC